MYIVKARNIGVLQIEDNYLGSEILKQWQMGKLPQVVSIGDETFLSRLIESIKKHKEDDPNIKDLPDEKIIQFANSFIRKIKTAKTIPQKDYSNNEIYPNSNNFLLHILAINNVISNNNKEKIWRVSMSFTTGGKTSLTAFNQIDIEHMSLLEMRDRYPEKYENYTKLLYKEQENLLSLDEFHERHKKFRGENHNLDQL